MARLSFSVAGERSGSCAFSHRTIVGHCHYSNRPAVTVGACALTSIAAGAFWGALVVIIVSTALRRMGLDCGSNSALTLRGLLVLRSLGRLSCSDWPDVRTSLPDPRVRCHLLFPPIRLRLHGIDQLTVDFNAADPPLFFRALAALVGCGTNWRTWSAGWFVVSARSKGRNSSTTDCSVQVRERKTHARLLRFKRPVALKRDRRANRDSYHVGTVRAKQTI